MLNEFQRRKVWENMLAAEARSLYFGDLASRYTHQKQWITGLSFFFSSGAAATIIGKTPVWVPEVLALVSAAATAYAIAMNLDGRVSTMAKLHGAWSRIALQYDRLWNRWGEEDAEDQLSRIVESEREPSEIATTGAPNNEALLRKWQLQVFKLYHLNPQHE